MEKERFITSSMNKPQGSADDELRPDAFADFPGQLEVKERLALFVQASKQRGDTLGHLLLSGPPGLGKTTLARIIANERGVGLKSSSGPVIEKAGDLAGLLTSLQEGDVLFIDEIHRLQVTVEEYLYSAMEDFFIDIMIDQGAGSRSVRLNLKKFTLVGATTRQGLLSSPLLSRFTHKERLDYYRPEFLQKILTRSARILDIAIDDEGALELARRSRGTPRVANNLLKWARDYAQVKADNHITGPTAAAALDMMKIDSNGLDEMDKRILEAMVFKFGGGPVGIKNVSVAVGEEDGTIEEVYEPFLIQEGYITRTRQGRVASPKTYKLLGAEHIMPDASQPSLF